MKRITFSEKFSVSKDIIAQYGAVDINLDKDNHIFIDPTLMLKSGDKKQIEAHQIMVNYIVYLYNMSQTNPRPNLNKYYTFKEVYNNWLGYSEDGNKGRGLGPGFAEELHKTLSNEKLVFNANSIPQKAFLFEYGHGLDSVNDFSVCLIKKYLLEYTEDFAKKYLKPEYCKVFNVDRVYFDYDDKKWKSKTYYLPYIEYDEDEYVLLTPKNIVNEDKSYINFDDFVNSVPELLVTNDEFRDKVNTHFTLKMYWEKSSEDRISMIKNVIKKEPEIIDIYIKHKLSDISTLKAKNSKLNSRIQELDYVLQLIADELSNNTEFYEIAPINIEKCRTRCVILKEYFESNIPKYSQLYSLSITDIRGILRSIWFNGQVIEQAKSQNWQETEFKIVPNGHIEQILKGRFGEDNTSNRVLCYLCFNEKDYNKLIKKVNEFNTMDKLVIIKIFNHTTAIRTA